MRFTFNNLFLFGGNLNNFSGFLPKFLNILSNLKLQLKLPDKKLKNSILFNFLANLKGAVDGDTGDNPHKVNHVDSIDGGMIADVRWLFCGQFVSLGLKIDQLVDSDEGVEFYEV